MNKFKKIIVGLTMFGLVLTAVPVQATTLTEGQISSILTMLQEFGADSQTISNVEAALKGQAVDPVTPPATGIPAACSGITFTRNLAQTMTGTDVKCLQALLNANPTFQVAFEGAGSPGSETIYFGTLTKNAVVKFQDTYASEVLTPIGLTAGTGFVGTYTRAKLNSMLTTGVVPVDPTDPDAPPAVGDPTAVLSSTPASANLPKNSALNPVLRFTLQAGGDALTVSNMVFKRTGMGAVTDWSKFYLFEGDTRLNEFGRVMTSDDHQVQFVGLSINIPAGYSKTYTLRADVAASPGVGNQSAFQLVGVTSNRAVTGVPLTGNVMGMGGIEVSAVTVAHGTTPSDPMVGAGQAEIATISVAAGNEAILLDRMDIEVRGTIPTTQVTNLKLYQGDQLLAETAGIGTNDRAVFILASPYEMAQGVTRIFTVKADLGGRVGDTVISDIKREADVHVRDKFLNAYIVITESFTAQTITLQGGIISAASKGPLAGNVARSTQNVSLLKAGITADRNVEVRSLKVDLASANDMILKTYLGETIRLRDADTHALLMSGTITQTTINTAQNNIELTGSFTLSANTTRNLELTVNTTGDPAIGTVTATLKFGADASAIDLGTGQDMQTTDWVPSQVSGGAQTIVATTLTSVLASQPISGTIVSGGSRDAVGARFSAVGTGVKITRIDARVYAATNTSDFANTLLANPTEVVLTASLKDGSTVLKTVNVVNVSGSYGEARFTGLNVIVPKSSHKDLVVEIASRSDLAATRYVAVTIPLLNVTAVTDDANQTSVAPSADINAAYTRVVTVATTGSLTSASAPDTSEAAIIPVGLGETAGSGAISMLRVRYTAVNEDVRIESIEVTRAGSATADAYSGIAIYDGETQVGASSFPQGADDVIVVLSTPVVVPANGMKTLDFHSTFNGVGAGVTSGQTAQLKAAIPTAVGAKGVSSGAAINTATDDREGSTMVLRQTVPTFTKIVNQTVLTQVNDEVLKFSVTADERYDVTFQASTSALRIDFNRSLGGAAGDTATLYRGSTQIAHATSVAAFVNFDLTDASAANRTIAAGQTITFTVKVSTATDTALKAEIKDVAASLKWNDGADVTDTTPTLIPGLPLTGETLVKPS